jgi:hypothetical protein
LRSRSSPGPGRATIPSGWSGSMSTQHTGPKKPIVSAFAQ